MQKLGVRAGAKVVSSAYLGYDEQPAWKDDQACSVNRLHSFSVDLTNKGPVDGGSVKRGSAK